MSKVLDFFPVDVFTHDFGQAVGSIPVLDKHLEDMGYVDMLDKFPLGPCNDVRILEANRGTIFSL